MKKLLKHVALALIRELIRHCKWRKIDWRKLFLAGAVMSVAGIVLPTFFLAYHWNIWFTPSPFNHSSHQSLNDSMHLSKNLPEVGLEPAAPFVSLNSSIEAQERPRASRS